MIASLLGATLAIAVIVAAGVAYFFNRPIASILSRIVPPDLSYAWAHYLRYAIFVVGIAGGVQVWNFEKYLTPPEPGKGLGMIELTSDRWLLEIFNALIGTLQSTAMVLLIFFVFALLAVVVVRLFESRTNKPEITPGK